MIDSFFELDASIIVATLALVGTIINKKVESKNRHESLAIKTNSQLIEMIESNKSTMAQMTETYRVNSRRLEEQIKELLEENQSLKTQMTNLVDENKELKGQITSLNKYLSSLKKL